MIPPKETFTLFKFKIDIEHKFKMFKIRFQILELNFPKVDGNMPTKITTCLTYMPKTKMFPKSCDNLKHKKKLSKIVLTT